MKSIRRIIKILVYNDFIWLLLRPFIKLAASMIAMRNTRLDSAATKARNDHYNKIFHSIIKDGIVLHGPFKGLKYPALEASGSALYPKIIGTYEKEIHPVIEQICSKSYTQIINIGSGEGYYAVGLARRIANACVYAFDTDPEARHNTAAMARVNLVSDRVLVDATCTALYLSEFKFTGRGLIISDCEGFEQYIFNRHNLHNFLHCDLLIETHDFVNINISTYLSELFSETHTIISVKSIDDIEKAKTYSFGEADGFDLETRKVLYGEGRPAIMEWLYLSPKG
jgi:hypothetical protein